MVRKSSCISSLKATGHHVPTEMLSQVILETSHFPSSGGYFLLRDPLPFQQTLPMSLLM